MITLNESEVHLWFTFYEQVDDEFLKCAYRALLDKVERAQESKFHFAKDRLRYLVTRALVRTTLSRYASVSPENWLFCINDYGRPEIANQLPELQLSFNVSHTSGLIVLGVTRKRALGVDAENVLTRVASIDIANQFFSSRESAELAKLPSDQQHDRFFEYWTLKESYIKARGMGLSIPLNKFNILLLNNHGIGLEIDPELCDSATRWMFSQFRLAPEYLIAVCAERSSEFSLKIASRKVIPYIFDETFPLEMLRFSKSGGADKNLDWFIP
jgi:4'-phosphopantetheinyl transferase